MKWRKHKYEFVVLERDLDTIGHMNNATYLEHFEAARWDFVTKGGYGLERIHELKIAPTILEIQIKFKKEIKLRQHVIIETQTLNYEGKVGELLQEMKSVDGETLCSAVFKFGLFDMNRRKLISPTEEWLKAIS